jgi:Domain of unknown function (DUF4129)
LVIELKWRLAGSGQVRGPTSLIVAGRVLILGAFVIVALSLVASIGAVDPSALPGTNGATPPSLPSVTTAPPSVPSGTEPSSVELGVLTIALLILTFMFLRRKRLRSGGYVFWQSVGALLGVAAFFLVGYAVSLNPLPLGFPQGEALAIAATMFAALAIVGGALVYYAIMERTKALRASAMERTKTPVSAAKELIAKLRTRLYSDRGGSVDRESVVACYSAMTRLLEVHGARDRPSYTPRELRANAGSALNISGRSIDDLTRLFEKARYGASTVTHGDALEAVEALEYLTGELEVGAP